MEQVDRDRRKTYLGPLNLDFNRVSKQTIPPPRAGEDKGRRAEGGSVLGSTMDVSEHDLGWDFSR